MQNVRIGFTVTVLVILGLGFVVSAGSAAGQGNQDQASRIQQKIERLHGLVQQRQKEGADLQPVGELMQDFEPLMQQQKFAEAEALLDRALELVNKLGSPTPTGPPPSLRVKMQRLQALFERKQQAGADLQPVGELMQDFEPLMQQQKFSEAEALVDRALKLLGESSTPEAPAPPQQPGTTSGATPPSLQAKMVRLWTLAQQRQQEGGDMQPIVAITDGIQPLLDQKRFSEAEALVDRALKLLGESSTPEAPASPQQPLGMAAGGVPSSLQAKMQRLHTLVERRKQEGADLQPVVELMQGFHPFMQQQKFAEAEALVDRTLKLLSESAAAPKAAAPPVALPKRPGDKNDPDFLVYQFMVDSQNPEEASTWVERLQAEFGRQKPGQSKYVGFGFFVEDMNDDVPSLRRKVESLLEIAEKYEMPVFIHLEGTMFWDRRSDRLFANPEAVEWSAFPAPGQKTGPIVPRIWFNWGDWTAFPVSPPCFESPLFRADVKERLEKAVAVPIREALERWRTGGVDRTYLFAGITVGNEVGIPDNRFNKIQLERNPASRPRDKGKALEMTNAEMVRGGYCSLYNRGYTAERIAEIARARFGGDDAAGKNTEAITTELLDEVVHDYMAFRAKTLADGLAGMGGAQKRIYTHTTSTVRKFMERNRPILAQSIPTVAAAVNPYSRPGFTVVRNMLDLPDVVAQMSAAARGTAAFAGGAWGAVESYATTGQPGRPQSREEYGAYLDQLFTSGAKLVSLLEAPQNANNPFTIAAESAGVKSAIKEWLRK